MGIDDEDDQSRHEAEPPDEARAYVPPTAIPPKTRRDTLELEARVRIAPTADPRRAPTMPRLDVTDDRRPTLRRLKPGEPTPPGPPVVLDEPVLRASALLPIVDEDSGSASLGIEVLARIEPDEGPPPSSRAKWKTDRLPIVQTPPPPAPESERPSAPPPPRRSLGAPLGAVVLLALVWLTWAKVRRGEDPSPALARSFPAPPAVELPAAPAAAQPAPIDEPSPPPAASRSEKAAEPSARAPAKPRTSAVPSATPPASAQSAPSVAPTEASPPASATPPAKSEPPELVQ